MRERVVDMSVTIGRLTLQNPVMPASGTFGYAVEMADLVDLRELGAIVVKGTTLHPRMGNPPNRFVEVAGCAFLTFVGLQNVGVQRFLDEKLPLLRDLGTPVIVNVAGESPDEFNEIAEALDGVEGVAALEINLACPNVAAGGASFSASPEAASAAVEAVRGATDLTLIAKIMPTLVGVGVVAKACADAGADAICPIWGSLGMAIDVQTGRSKLGENLMGALGGPALKPLHLRLAYEAAEVVDVPVIGCGGICGWEDALEFIRAGAAAVQIGSAGLIDPSIFHDTIQGIHDWAADRGIGRLRDIVGSFKRPPYGLV